MEVPANTALVVCREKGGILNILLSPLAEGGQHERHEEVARCLEAVSTPAAFGGGSTLQHAPSAGPPPGLPKSRSVASLSRPDSQGMLEGPTDSGDSGHAAPFSPLAGCQHGHHGFGAANRLPASGPAVSVGEDDRLTGHTASVLCLAAANGLLFSGGTDSLIRVGRRQGLRPALHEGLCRCPADGRGCRGHAWCAVAVEALTRQSLASVPPLVLHRTGVVPVRVQVHSGPGGAPWAHPQAGHPGGTPLLRCVQPSPPPPCAR